MDGEDKDETNDKNYDLEQDNDEDSEDKEDDDNNDNNGYRDDAPEIDIMNDGDNVNKQAEVDKEPPGVDNETQGVDEIEEIPGVDDAKETPGADDKTQSDKIEVGGKSTERLSSGMSLCRQPQKEYNRKNYNDNVSNITDRTQGDGIILLQLNSDNFEITEST